MGLVGLTIIHDPWLTAANIPYVQFLIYLVCAVALQGV